MLVITQEDVNCPHCGRFHYDVEEWALKPHRTHLCLHCNSLFEGSVKAVSRPTFQTSSHPINVIFEDLDDQKLHHFRDSKWAFKRSNRSRSSIHVGGFSKKARHLNKV